MKAGNKVWWAYLTGDVGSLGLLDDSAAEDVVNHGGVQGSLGEEGLEGQALQVDGEEVVVDGGLHRERKTDAWSAKS